MSEDERRPLLGVQAPDSVSEDDSAAGAAADPHGGSGKPTTYLETLANFLKGNIGSGQAPVFVTVIFSAADTGGAPRLPGPALCDGPRRLSGLWLMRMSWWRAAGLTRLAY